MLNIIINLYIIGYSISLVCFLVLCTKYGVYLNTLHKSEFIMIAILNIVWPILWVFLGFFFLYIEIKLLKEHLEERKLLRNVRRNKM